MFVNQILSSPVQFARKRRKFKRDPFAGGGLHADFSAAIGRVNKMLAERGFGPLPTAKYRFFKQRNAS